MTRPVSQDEVTSSLCSSTLQPPSTSQSLDSILFRLSHNLPSFGNPSRNLHQPALSSMPHATDKAVSSVLYIYRYGRQLRFAGSPSCGPLFRPIAVLQVEPC